MAKQIIRFGMIGCGLMGREFGSAVARWCHLLDQGVVPRIVGVCDANSAMMRWFQDSFDTIQIATQDYHDLLNRTDIDAIYCAVPHNLHERIYIDCIEAGKHPGSSQRYAPAVLLCDTRRDGTESSSFHGSTCISEDSTGYRYRGIVGRRRKR